MTTPIHIDDEELTEEFQRDHDNWDFENAEVHEGVQNPNARYVIHLSRQESEAVGEAAEAMGVTIFEFIRQAAIAAALDGGAAQLQMAIAELRDAVARTNSALDVIESAKTAATGRPAD